MKVNLLIEGFPIDALIDYHMCSKHYNKNIICKAVIFCQQKSIFTSNENVNVNIFYV